MAPHTPRTLGTAPAPPGPSSTARFVPGDPDIAPHPAPDDRKRPGTAGVRLDRSIRSRAERRNRRSRQRGRPRATCPAGSSGRTSRSSPSATCAPPSARSGAERLPDARWYDSAESLLADTAARLRRHLHAAVEPRATDPGRARRAACTCSARSPWCGRRMSSVSWPRWSGRRGCVLHTVHNWHHAPIVRLAADLLRAGAIGRPTRVVWHTLRTRPRRRGTGRATTGASIRRWREAAC